MKLMDPLRCLTPHPRVRVCEMDVKAVTGVGRVISREGATTSSSRYYPLFVEASYGPSLSSACD